MLIKVVLIKTCMRGKPNGLERREWVNAKYNKLKAKTSSVFSTILQATSLNLNDKSNFLLMITCNICTQALLPILVQGKIKYFGKILGLRG